MAARRGKRMKTTIPAPNKPERAIPNTNKNTENTR